MTFIAWARCLSDQRRTNMVMKSAIILIAGKDSRIANPKSCQLAATDPTSEKSRDRNWKRPDCANSVWKALTTGISAPADMRTVVEKRKNRLLIERGRSSS